MLSFLHSLTHFHYPSFSLYLFLPILHSLFNNFSYDFFSGLHAQLQKWNIEALTLQLIPYNHSGYSQASIYNNLNNQQNQKENKKLSDSRMKSKRDRPIETSHLSGIILDFLLLSSNLHEELHHSLFYYIIMDSQTFVVNLLINTDSFIEYYIYMYYFYVIIGDYRIWFYDWNRLIGTLNCVFKGLFHSVMSIEKNEFILSIF